VGRGRGRGGFPARARNPEAASASAGSEVRYPYLRDTVGAYAEHTSTAPRAGQSRV